MEALVAGLLCMAAVTYMLASTVLGSLPGAGTETEAEWQEFTSDEGGFSVLFPAAPRAETQPVNTVAGTIQMHNHTATGGAFEYAVSYADYPEWIAQADPTAALDGAVEGAAANVDGSIASHESIRLSGYPGRDVTIEARQACVEATVRTRIYLVGKRLYMVVVVAPRDQYSESDATAYLDSFRLRSR